MSPAETTVDQTLRYVLCQRYNHAIYAAKGSWIAPWWNKQVQSCGKLKNESKNVSNLDIIVRPSSKNYFFVPNRDTPSSFPHFLILVPFLVFLVFPVSLFSSFPPLLFFPSRLRLTWILALQSSLVTSTGHGHVECTRSCLLKKYIISNPFVNTAVGVTFLISRWYECQKLRIGKTAWHYTWGEDLLCHSWILLSVALREPLVLS